MPARPRSLLVLALAAVTLLTLVHGAASAPSLEEARRERDAVQQRLDAAAEELAGLEARIGELADDTAGLEARVAELVQVADEAETRVAARVRELYKRGIDLPVLQLLRGQDATDAIERAQLAGHLLAGDRVEIETAAAARTRATEVADRLAVRRAELDAARDEQQATLAALRDDLERATALQARLEQEAREREEARRQEEARRRAAERAASAASPPAAGSAPVSGGGRACPVGRPHSFTDTWGAPRSGGRSHKGVDILANYGTPVYAITSGVWDVRSYGSSAGNWAILRGSDGTTYYYMHLQSHTVGDGARVGAGQQTGTVGDTGNATGTPHLHFEVHPGGGGAVNPYPYARAAC